MLGSTAKMGAGTNVQDRLIASHDLDCPWRPGDLEQRAGRIVRQGNQNSDVYVYRYVTAVSYTHLLKEHRTITYNNLLLSGKLTAHLMEIDRAAVNRMEEIVSELAKRAGATEALLSLIHI